MAGDRTAGNTNATNASARPSHLLLKKKSLQIRKPSGNPPHTQLAQKQAKRQSAPHGMRVYNVQNNGMVFDRCEPHTKQKQKA